MKQLILITSFALFAITAMAQPYQTAAGIRFSPFLGISVKHFMKENLAVEGIMSTRWRGAALIALVEYEKEIPGAAGLYFLAGGGVHIGSYQKFKYYNYTGVLYSSNDRVFSPGIDGIIGLDYKFSEMPLNISLDLRPYIDFVEGGPPSYIDGAITARYTF